MSGSTRHRSNLSMSGLDCRLAWNCSAASPLCVAGPVPGTVSPSPACMRILPNSTGQPEPVSCRTGNTGPYSCSRRLCLLTTERLNHRPAHTVTDQKIRFGVRVSVISLPRQRLFRRPKKAAGVPHWPQSPETHPVWRRHAGLR